MTRLARLGRRRPHLHMRHGVWWARWGAHYATGRTPKVAYDRIRLHKNWADQERDRYDDLELALRPSLADRLRELSLGTYPSVIFKARHH